MHVADTGGPVHGPVQCDLTHLAPKLLRTEQTAQTTVGSIDEPIARGNRELLLVNKNKIYTQACWPQSALTHKYHLLACKSNHTTQYKIYQKEVHMAVEAKQKPYSTFSMVTPHREGGERERERKNPLMIL